MFVPVVLKDGQEELVSKDELQLLIDTEQIMFFRRFEGWTVLGHDEMRQDRVPYQGRDRRQSKVSEQD